MGAQPPAPQPSLPLAFCNLHPGEQVVGFCASCLRERLAALETAGSADPPRKSTSSVLKSMFFRSSSTIAAGGPSSSSNNFLSSSSVGPELRRCKSFSASRDVAVPVAVEPKRKSCDVRARNTLWSLFHQDDTIAGGTGNRIVECPNLEFSHSFEATEDEVREDREEIMAAPKEEMDEEKKPPPAEMKPMKYHIDLESQAKKPQAMDLKEIAGSFILAASVFSHKLRNWRRKQKLKKKPPSAMPSNKNGITTSRLCDAQSEIVLDAFGRRSCDIDPRFSLDAGRFSFEDPRCSWDAPRASWDGYLIGSGRSLLPRLPPMLAVVEDAPAASAVKRFDSEIPVEEDSLIPGGPSQTRDYYDGNRRSLDHASDSTMSQSFENSDPIRPTIGEPLVYHNGSKQESNSKGLSSHSPKYDFSGSLNSSFRNRRPKAPSLKKSRRWSKAWSIWGFIQRRGGGRGRTNGVERSLSETWPELPANGYNERLCRSHSSISSRSWAPRNSGFGSMKRDGLEINGCRKKKEAYLERNRSARYSPSHFGTGLLRFYLPPLNGGRRRGAWGRSKYSSPHSFKESILSLY